MPPMIQSFDITPSHSEMTGKGTNGGQLKYFRVYVVQFGRSNYGNSRMTTEFQKVLCSREAQCIQVVSGQQRADRVVNRRQGKLVDRSSCCSEQMVTVGSQLIFVSSKI